MASRFSSRAWLIVPPLLWAGLIFWLSSVPELESGLRPAWDLVLRKLAHAAEYAVLAILLARAGRYEHHPRSRRRIFLTALIASVVYAISDELHQTTVVGRRGAAPDVLIDSVGALTGLVLYVRTWKPYKSY